MNMKDTAILLLFLLCILGLTVGVYYTEVNETIKKTTKYERTVHEDGNVITVSLDKIEKEETVLNNLFT